MGLFDDVCFLSNERVEIGVKAAKRIIQDNLSSYGFLDNDKAAQAIMQYRNTPLSELKLSKSQILFFRQLRDHLPSHASNYTFHESWCKLAIQRQQLVNPRDKKIEKPYDLKAGKLQPLPLFTSVLIREQGTKHYKKWNKTGRIIELVLKIPSLLHSNRHLSYKAQHHQLPIRIPHHILTPP